MKNIYLNNKKGNNNLNKKIYNINQKGITLIALVITIIILLMLSGISIYVIINNGIIDKTIDAVEETKISQYKEQIEIIKINIRTDNEKYELPTIYQLKDALDNEVWVASTKFIIDREIEKLELITKDGYIFYITDTKTEYKGKENIIDTSALEKEGVIELEALEQTSNGRNVKITNLAEEYYKIKYQIGSEGGEWIEINSGDILEVPYGQILYAKLFYGPDGGTTHRLSIDHTNPTITAKNTNTSNMTRKTQTALAELFDITWGSDGTGTIEYEVTGNLNFNNITFKSTDITNLSQLELGIYNIKCTITSPNTETSLSEIKTNVKISNLANTIVTNYNNQNVTAKAIYSAYDLAYFRDLVNNGDFNINAKVMNHIDLNTVCSESIGSWEPIGNFEPDNVIKDANSIKIYFSGTFDGGNYNINNLYIKNNLYRQGLFGIMYENGYIKNIKVNGTINNTSAGTGGICAFVRLRKYLFL